MSLEDQIKQERMAMSLRSRGDELAEKDAHLADLYSHHVSDWHGAPSTVVTYLATGIEGGLRGALGASANIGGVVPVTGLLGVAMAFGAMFVDDPGMNEVLNAGARGFGSPMINDAAYRLGLKWRNPKMLARLQELDAIGAAEAAAPNAAATKAAQGA